MHAGTRRNVAGASGQALALCAWFLRLLPCAWHVFTPGLERFQAFSVGLGPSGRVGNSPRSLFD